MCIRDRAGWIYEQWIDRLQRVAARFASRTEESLATLLRLESRGESIIASVTGETQIQSIDGLPAIANSLFNELVLAKHAMRRAAFLGDVDNLLVDSELRWFDGYREDAEVEFLNDDGYPVQILYFPHLWDSKILNRRLVCLLYTSCSRVGRLRCPNAADGACQQAEHAAHTLKILQCRRLAGKGFQHFGMQREAALELFDGLGVARVGRQCILVRQPLCPIGIDDGSRLGIVD